MNDDPAMTDVLYAKVHMKDGSDSQSLGLQLKDVVCFCSSLSGLQMVADRLVERFVASGLMLKEWDRVKLHATVMNTLFRKDPTEERNNTMPGKSSFKERESFNGQNILKEVEDDYIKSWEDNQPGDEALDTTKDPCQKVKCSRHKVCVAQGYQRAMCISRKKLEHRIKPLGPKAHGGCKPCHAAPVAAVCGSDGHTYSSACKLEQQACLASKQLTVRCEGQCPCPTPRSPAGDSKQELCTGQDLADLGDRLRDWFQLLRENAKQNGSGGLPASPTSALERSVAATCKEAVGWMFARLDTSGDLFLEAAELAAINLDKYEVCIRAFFNSCDTSKDGRVSAPEWCFCFWREKPPCLRELEKIQIQEATKKKLGTFIPSCDEDGYYRRAQCEPGGGECWCVDQHGAELTGTRGHGSPDCDEATGFSGDFGSSVGWEDEEEKEPEEAGEEGEEEEGEAGEGDDGGYIW
ncbi:testican-2-like isoform X4 [Onychostruthus taczanowskii]|nr:testican-2-like isoform X4 [Onychostruthus taczanowskii]XP_041261077.1 testican-2-like isoform X4 [Onychostruthus taczanowskii]